MNAIFTIPEAPGQTFRVIIEFDDDTTPPWQREDGHGPVRCDTTQKKPGERVLHVTRLTTWLYDWQAACKLARKDGWDAEPIGAPGRIERAVQADFDYLRRWCNDDWHYVGVVVTRDGSRERAALWGIESDAGGYLMQVAEELAEELAYTHGVTAAQVDRESTERAYWEARDVITEVRA